MKLKRIAAALLTLIMLLGMMPASLAEGGNIIGGGSFEVHTHSWTSWRWCEGDEGTCIRQGSQVRNCKTCSNGWEDREAYGDHDWGSWKTTEEATCTEKGKQERKCNLCGERKTRKTDKAPHSYGEWTVITEPGEYTPGVRERKCRDCSHVQQENFYPEGTLKRGSKNDKEAVKALQEGLNDAGYDCGTVDGDFGKKTENAIKQLQEDRGLNPDGIAWPSIRQMVEHQFGEWYVKVDATPFTKGIMERACQKCGHTQQQEFYPDGTLFRGDKDNEAVRALQQGLNNAGHNCGYPDGDFGPGTERAIKSFQSANGMEPDGIGWPGLQDMLGSGKSALEAEILIEVVDVVAPIVDRLPEYTANVATEGFSFKELRWLYNGAALADGERFKLDETYTVEVQVEGDTVDAARLKASINGEAASVQVKGGVITVSCDMVCVLPAGGMLATMDLGGRMPASVAVTIQQPRVGFYPDRHASIVVTRVDGTTFTAGQYGGNAAEWYSQNGVNFNQPFQSTEEQYKFVNQISIPYAPELTATVNGVSAQVESYNGGAAIQVSAWLDCLPGENVTLSVTGLDAPQEGVQPDTAVSLASEPECEVKNIRWYEINWRGAESFFYGDGAASSAFKPGCSYRVEIEVASKDGRIYPAFDYISATINGQTADKIGVRNDLIKLSYTFPKIEHAPFEISGFDVPAAGVPLDYEGMVQGPVEGTIQSVEWRKMLEKTCAPGDKAEWGGYYRLTVEIETKQPIPSDPKASINGITDGVKVKVTDGYHMEVWYEFPAVGGAHVVDVTDVTKPAIGEAADSDCTIATPGFKLAKLNGMYWEVNGERVASGYAFQPGDAATVVINASLSTGTMMNPTEAAKLSATVNGEAATAAVRDGKLEIRFSFPPAELTKVSEISILFDNYEIGGTPDMEGKVTKAKAEDGTSVALTISGISWYDISTGEYIGVDNVFEPSHQYRVSGSLKAPEDYQFTKADTSVTVNNHEASFDLGSFDNSAMRFTCIFEPLTTKGEIKTITRIVATMPKPTRDNCPGRDQLSLTVYCEDGTTGACVLDKYYCYDSGFVDGVFTGMDDGYIDLEMSIKPSDGYIIDEYAIATVNGMAANVNVTGGGTGAEIKHEFYVPYQGENCKISSLNILVNEPYPEDVIDYHPNAAGMCLPVENLGTRPAGITIESVKWQDLTSLSVLGNTDQAVGGHDYRFTVKVSADQGYEFIPSPQVTVNGKAVNCIADGTVLMIQADFYCTPMPGKAIKSVGVYIPVPIAGNNVSFTPNLFATTQNNDGSTNCVNLNRVSWLDYSAGRMQLEGDVFEVGHVYELTVSVSAADGYTFINGVKGLVNNLDPDSSVLASGILTIKKTFTCREAAGNQDSSNGINGNYTYTDTDIVFTPLTPEGEDNNYYFTDSVVTPVKPVTPVEPVIPVEPELPGKLEIGNLAVSKRVSSSPANGSYYVPGETVSFEVSVVNTGEVKLEGIAVSDHMMAENTGVQSYASMDPGTAEFFSFGYTVSEMDAAAGSITNVATAAGFAEDGTRYAAVSNAVTVPTGMDDWPMGVITELSIVKEETSSPANGAYYTEGETISYLITYTNTGETRLGETIVYDTLAGEIASAEGLDSSEDRICYFNHRVTASDVARGYVANAAIAQYDMGGGYMGSATSNTVISDTDGDLATVPGEFGSIDWGLLQVEQPDTCLRKLISHDGEGTAYEIDFCTGHQATHKAIQTMLKAAGDDVNRQRMAWERAYGLWQKELDVMYEKLLGAADDVAKITIMSERVRYLTMVANTQFALQIANPEKGAENARVIANLWRDKCVDLCCEISPAPGGRADSFLAVPRGEPADELGETCICTVTAEDTEKSAWTDGFCFTHGFTYEMMQALLESEISAETWETIYSLWDYELNTAYNAVYDKASDEGGIAYLTEYAAYTTWLPARLDELKLFYPEDEIPAEVMANTIMARALAICARLPQA